MAEASVATPVRHQRVGWLELFYDLVFVVAIERLTHLLHGDPSRTRIAATIGLTMLVWFAWFNVPDTDPIDFVGGSQLGIVAGLVLMAAGLADAIHAAHPEHGSPHLHSGSLLCLCLGLILVHTGTRSLTREALAVNLGLPMRQRPRSSAEREQMKAQRAAARSEREARRGQQDPGGLGRALRGALTQGFTYLFPVVVVWWLGRHWAPWIVIALLFAYVAGAIWAQGLGERRIIAYVTQMRDGQAPADTTSHDAP